MARTNLILQVQKECKFFLWYLLHRGLNTADRLQVCFRSPVQKLVCLLSSDLFLHCPFTNALGSHLFCIFQIQTAIPNCIGAFIFENASTKPPKCQRDILWSNTFGSLSWNLWLQCNDYIFRRPKDLWRFSLGRHYYICICLFF